MNWLAKINLNIVAQRLGPFRSAILLLLLILTCLFCGYRIGNFFHGYQLQTLAQQKQRLDSLYAYQTQQDSQIDRLEVELEVERLANERSMKQLKAIETEHYQVKKELAFYEKVMAPEKQADGLVIDDLSVWSTESPHHYRFQVTLVQQLLRRRSAKGYVQLEVVGSLNDKPHTLALSQISSQTQKQLPFSFQYFQIIEGEFTLPADFIAETVTISAILTKSKWQKYKRLDENYDWPSVIHLENTSE
ncbi:DUF6776 family protein [Colwelliaceae bacterium 6471]